MIETPPTMTLEEREQGLGALRTEYAATVDALAPAEADLTAAERALGIAQAVYDAAGREVGRATMVAAPPGAYEPWTTPAPGDEERTRAAVADARAGFDQAGRELGPRLVARTNADVRRGNLLMHARVLTDRIERAEAELERARREPEPRDLLAGIRARLGFGPEAA